MTLLPFTDCCLLLGVDPKTLRLWLTSAHLSCTRSPTDARLKCLTPSQLHHLAELHDRFLPDPLPGEASERGSSPAFASLPAQTASPQESPAVSSVAAPPPEADLRHQFTLAATLRWPPFKSTLPNWRWRWCTNSNGTGNCVL